MPWAHTQCTYDWATWYWRDRMTGLWLRTAPMTPHDPPRHPMTPHDTPRPSSCVLAWSTDICFDGLNLLCPVLLHLQKHRRTSPVGRRLESAGSLVKRYSWAPPQSVCCSRNWHFQQVFWWCHCRWFRDHTFRTTGLVKTTQDGNWSTAGEGSADDHTLYHGKARPEPQRLLFFTCVPCDFPSHSYMSSQTRVKGYDKHFVSTKFVLYLNF